MVGTQLVRGNKTNRDTHKKKQNTQSRLHEKHTHNYLFSSSPVEISSVPAPFFSRRNFLVSFNKFCSNTRSSCLITKKNTFCSAFVCRTAIPRAVLVQSSGFSVMSAPRPSTLTKRTDKLCFISPTSCVIISLSVSLCVLDTPNRNYSFIFHTRSFLTQSFVRNRQKISTLFRCRCADT